MDLRIFFFITILLLAGKGYSQIRLKTSVLETTTLVSGLYMPWNILWGPDNHIWMTERYGRVSRINPNNGKQQVLKVIEEVHQEGEAGLLGMALHPDFLNQPFLFLVYTYLQGQAIIQKVVRYQYTHGQLINATAILDGIPANFNHTGSRLIFLKDTTLLITTGDALNAEGSQDINFLGGKVLRINPDGSIPPDNPFPGSPVWAYGLRNSQGLALHPNSLVYASEHGPHIDDEINVISRGRNYGWPFVNGFCDEPEEITFCNERDIKEPLTIWPTPIAPSGITIYNHPAIPEFNNAILVSALRGQMLAVLKLSGSGETIESEEHYLQYMFGRIRDVLQGPFGEVYLALNGPSPQDIVPFTHSLVRLHNPEFPSMGNKIVVFTNPLNNTIHIKIEEFTEKMHIKILSLLGQTIFEMPVESKFLIIDGSFLSNGVYLLQLSDSDQNLEVVKLLTRK
jgi:aldose sugar dehydrogenase